MLGFKHIINDFFGLIVDNHGRYDIVRIRLKKQFYVSRQHLRVATKNDDTRVRSD